jgi:two-component system response regulator FixJ
MGEPVRVALVDDDSGVLDSLRLYLERQGFKTVCFASAETLLAALDCGGRLDCIVADVRMPGLSGLDLVQCLNARSVVTPIILITAHGDVEMAVSAIKQGAFDFIQKPFDPTRLLVSIRNALEVGDHKAIDAAHIETLRSRLKTLSERQRQVMELAVVGLSNKAIGSQLNISPKTVEYHRAWVMERMGARNLAELVRIATQLNQGTQVHNVLLHARGEPNWR